MYCKKYHVLRNESKSYAFSCSKTLIDGLVSKLKLYMCVKRYHLNLLHKCPQDKIVLFRNH